MEFTKLLLSGRQLIKENSSTILTATAVTGTVTTAYLTGKGSFRAAEIIRRREQELRHETGERVEQTNKEIVQLVWTEYIPAVGVGTLTVASIVMANRISAKHAAALATAYGLSERALLEYKTKVVEKLGENKAAVIRDEIAQDRVSNRPVSLKEVIIAGSGEVLCFDAITGRYFMSSVEEIKKAQNTVNYDILNHMYASLSSFYEEIGLPPTSYSDEVGWNSDHPLEVTFSTTMSSDDRPCVVVDFVTGPVPNYTQFY